MQPNPDKATYLEGIHVKNAGLVILSSYIPILFDRLKLPDKNNFINKELQAGAVHYLQYLVTGFSATAAELLPLNNVLCGLPVSTPVKNSINISNENKELMNGLISAVISNWSKIAGTSVEGFRATWLVGDGLLTEYADKWQLTIDKRGYDVLLQTAPFSFSVIKLPWMEKTLHVSRSA